MVTSYNITIFMLEIYNKRYYFFVENLGRTVASTKLKVRLPDKLRVFYSKSCREKWNLDTSPGKKY